MDTQGHDIAVFDGGDKVHGMLVGLQSELSIKRIYKDTMHWTDAIAHYEHFGFDLAGLHQVNSESDDLCEIDCFIVRRPDELSV